jgi:hypothetical protein
VYTEGQGCQDGSVVAEAGQPITISCDLCNGVGRRPKGLCATRFERAKGALGDYLARAAHLEAASVLAFHALGDELRAHGAPRALVEMAERSARDEVSHARVTERLARRHGGATRKPRTAGKKSVRALEAIARENAVEGCVRETFGAMVATWQAAHAGDLELRAAMKKIAVDETRHAALAWETAKWLDARLDAAARNRVKRARDRAVKRLAKDVTRALPRELVRDAGLPTPARAGTFVRAMEAALWV